MVWKIGMRARTSAAGALAAAVTFVLLAGPAAAQVVVPDPSPDATMPGAALVSRILGWLKYGSIAAAVAGILGGGIAAGVGHFGGHTGAAMVARKWLLGGIGAAVIAGMAHAVVVQVYEAT